MNETTTAGDLLQTLEDFNAVRRLGDEHHVCGCTNLDGDGRAQAEARFPDVCSRDITVFINAGDWPGDGVMGMTWGEWVATYMAALGEWQRAIGVTFRRVEREAEAVAVVDFDDLAGTTLAWSHLADGSCKRNKRQRYDHRRWTPQLLRLTVLHEVGHLLGLQHQNGPYIMNPSILTGLEGLTSTDVARARALGYGPPAGDQPGPDPGDAPTPDPRPTPGPGPLPPSIPWGSILAFAIEQLAACMKNAGREAVRDGLQRPGLRQLLGLRKAARQAGLRGAALREAVEAGRLRLAAMSLAEVDLLCDEAAAAASE